MQHCKDASILIAPLTVIQEATSLQVVLLAHLSVVTNRTPMSLQARPYAPKQHTFCFVESQALGRRQVQVVEVIRRISAS